MNEKFSRSKRKVVKLDLIKSKKIITNEPVANFFLLNFDNAKLSSDQAFNLFLEKNILLRKMDSYEINNALRLTIGNDEQNIKFLDILERNF